ncbi:alpha/beta hydrolase [Vibrio metschnikovii]
MASDSIPNTERIKAINHHKPILSQWSAQIQQYLDQQTLPIIIVAHSFGCLAALDAIARKTVTIESEWCLICCTGFPVSIHFLWS